MTQVKSCKCESAFQNTLYGTGQRLHNTCKDGLRCTVCGNVVKTTVATPVKTVQNNDK